MPNFIIIQGDLIFYKAVIRQYFIHEPASSICFFWGYKKEIWGMKWKKENNGLLGNVLQIRYWSLFY